MSQQYYPIIFQIGSRFINAGFAGDAVPIVRRRTNTYDLDGVQLTPLRVTHAHDKDIPSEKELGSDEDSQFLWTYDLVGLDTDKIEAVLERVIHDIYQSDLLIDPKKCKVLVIEPPFFPLPLKRIITRVLLFHIHAQSVRFFSEPIMSSIGSGSHCALVIDIGWNQTVITPVFDFRQLYKHTKATLRAGRWLHDVVRRSMSDKGCLSGGFEFVEQFISEAMYSGIENVESADFYNFEGTQIPSSIRYQPIESTFYPTSKTDDENTRSIADLVTECYEEISIDVRGALRDKVIITGGVSYIPGFKSRLLKELKERTGAEGIQALGSWEGASLYCSTALMTPSSVQDRKRWPELIRDKYLAGESAVLDWTDDLYGRAG